MSTPANAFDPVITMSAVYPLNTSTAIHYIKTSGTDTGTVATTSRTLDLSRALHYGSTGGKPLDVTVHRRAGGPPRWTGVSVLLAGEANFHSSGLNTYVTVAHKCRSATSGAGSTFRTLKTDVFRLKMGTDTDAVFHWGLESAASLMAGDRYYKANITYSRKLASSTAAKDTTTGQAPFFVNSAIVRLVADGAHPQVTVPYKVS